MHRYHINVFWYPDDERWIADVPDLKGCSAHGANPEVSADFWLVMAFYFAFGAGMAAPMAGAAV